MQDKLCLLFTVINVSGIIGAVLNRERMYMTEMLFSYIDELYDEYVDFLKKICSFEARATDKEEIDKLIDYIEEFTNAKGFVTEKTLFSKCGNFLTVDINPGKEKGHLFLAHTDTVHFKGAFGKNPVSVSGDRMRAPGAVDCKGGIAIALLAMEALMKSGYDKHTRLILTSDEEISNILGGEKEMDFFHHSVDGFRSALNCETTRRNEVVVSRKGIIRKRIDVFGISGHSGSDYFTSANAVLEAANKIVELEKLSKRGGITYNCSVIDGGTLGNIIADKCSFIVDIRYPDVADMETAEENVKKITAHSYVEGTHSKSITLSTRKPMVKDRATMKLFDALNSVSCKYNLGTLTPIESGAGSDSAYTQEAGVPSICGIGGSGDYFHTDKEYINLNCITQRAKIIGAFCIEE